MEKTKISGSVKVKRYKIKVDDLIFVFDQKIVTGKEILEKAGMTPVECFTLYQKFRNHEFEKIVLHEEVDLSKRGIERFAVKPPEVFNYFVDAEPETTDQATLTPNKILALAGIVPVEDYYLVQIKPDGTQVSYKDSPNTPIEMVCSPAMKFVSAFRGETPVSDWRHNAKD
ncbi:MAG: multiubiquitin domain-containing protein [Calditrichaeota bacterium]|nr:multiubiquitin domain-containing protein [Calditrichota bacterium]MCB0270232.1 multiubiquitin domain-containing protein [Calditrichota bacterium]